MNSSKSVFTVFSLLLSLSIFSACSLSTSSEEEEMEPVGLALYDGSQIVLTQQINGTVEDTVFVNSNSSIELRAAFLDETGTPFTPDPAEHALDLAVTNGANLISIEQSGTASATFYFTINGITAGEATFTVNLLHENANEFTSKALPVKVTEAN